MKRTLVIMVLVLFAATMTATSIAVEDSTISKITVTGDGEESSAPDMVTIVLGVETKNVSAAAAAEENADMMNTTLYALRSAGVPDEDMKTSDYSITPPYSDDFCDCPKDVAEPQEFTVTNHIMIETNLTGTDVGAILDAAVSAGANDVVGVTFGLREPEPLREKALQKAVADAMKDAEMVAQAAGVTLGRILTITEGYTYTPTSDAIAYSKSATPIVPADVKVAASVTLEYEIAG